MNISPVSRSRITHIKNPTYSGGTIPIEKTTSTPKTDNNSKSPNFEFGKENFYDKLNDYKANMEKEKNNSFKKNNNQHSKNCYNFSKEEKELISNIKNIFNNFNTKIDTIKSIDIARGHNNLSTIKQVYNQNSTLLSTMGIYTDKLFHFYIKEDQFARSILNQPSRIIQLTDPINGFIKKMIVALTIITP